jgi:Ca-activated chloride channel family protein
VGKLAIALRAVLATLACGVLSAAQDPKAQGPQPTFRSAVDLVMLHVSVTNGSGGYLQDVERSEFQVLEDGRPQQLRLFERGGLPLAVMLFLDVSSSMSHVFPKVQHAAIQFLEQLTPRDVASVVTFANRVQILQPFTADRQALVSAVEHVTPHGGTRLFNALYVGLKELNRPLRADQTAPRRRVAVVLTDGYDTASLVGIDDVMDFAKRTDIAIYAIRLIGSASSDDVESQSALNRLTRETGGRAFLSVSEHSVGRVYQDIRTELARQYALGYVSDDLRKDGRFRRLSVRVMRPGARARTRFGYFAPLARLDPRRR